MNKRNETEVAVVFLGTSLGQKWRGIRCMTSLHWQTSLQTQTCRAQLQIR